MKKLYFLLLLIPFAGNSQTFIKSKDADYCLRSKNLNVGIYLNLKDWSFSKPDSSEYTEYDFTCKSVFDVAGYLVVEKGKGISLERLGKIAIENARKSASRVVILRKEYRTVNGVRLLCLQMDVAIKRINVSTFGYYYTNANGAVQLVASTASRFFQQRKGAMENFLNGFVVL
jgi:hypothetical protein